MPILKSDGVPLIVEKMTENWFRWFWHVERRLIDFAVRRIDQTEISQTTVVEKDLEKL